MLRYNCYVIYVFLVIKTLVPSYFSLLNNSKHEHKTGLEYQALTSDCLSKIREAIKINICIYDASTSLFTSSTIYSITCLLDTISFNIFLIHLPDGLQPYF